MTVAYEQNLAEIDDRMPPGQTRTVKFPVLHEGAIPGFDLERWNFATFGCVTSPLSLTYKMLVNLPRIAVKADFHCVTKWSRLENHWDGVAFRTVAALTQPTRDARFVAVHCDGGYETNLPLDVLMDDDVLFADRHDGSPLTPEHGFPLRLVVPKRYGWKSAKWVRSLEFLRDDRPGYWEARGYHNNGDPWREERRWDAQPIPNE